jgi:hypothetical protein
MTTILATTVRRHTPYTESSGFIYAFDLEKKEVAKRCTMIEPPYRDKDTNPRGGLRGSRGIAVRDDQIAIANASMIVRFDPQWNILGLISTPSFAAVHDIVFDEDTLWVTAARIDVLMQVDLSGNLLRYYYLREPSPALKDLGWRPDLLIREADVRGERIEYRDSSTHEEEVYDRAHVNSVVVMPDGDLLVSLGMVLDTKFATLLRVKNRLLKAGIWPLLLAANRRLRGILGVKKNMHSDLVVQPARAQSAIIRISPDDKRELTLTLDDVTVPSHSLMQMPDGTIVYLNTTKGEVVHFEASTGDVISITKVTDGFLRGVTLLPDSSLLLGSKGELLKYDLSTCQILDSFCITDDKNESVYDLMLLPSHYSLPPDSFEDHFEKAVGSKAEDVVRQGRQLVIA